VEKGKLDIVFANAGVVRFAPFGTITEEFYDSIFNINVKGLLFTVQKALPPPCAHSHGHGQWI
jgi:NADP-dependent 3-hydroxy acid dehydrogenase YdfG